MVSKTLYFTESSIKFLETLNKITFSEHIRRAVDEYIKRIQNEAVSASQSKGSEDNG